MWASILNSIYREFLRTSLSGMHKLAAARWISGRRTEAPHQSAEPSNNAGPHHRAKKLSIAHADYRLAERVTIAANGYQGQGRRDWTIRTRACLPLDDRVRPGFGRKAAKLSHVANTQGPTDRFTKILA